MPIEALPPSGNPISSCYIHAAISVVRQHAAALTDAMLADHGRSTGPWEIEWIVLPEAFRPVDGHRWLGALAGGDPHRYGPCAAER